MTTLRAGSTLTLDEVRDAVAEAVEADGRSHAEIQRALGLRGRGILARALDPERLLATPNLKPDDAEYLGRIGEINRMVVHGNDRLAAQQQRLRADVEGLERKLDLIVDLLRGHGGGD